MKILKVLIVSILIATFTLPAHGLDTRVVRTIPCMRPLLAPIGTATLSTFWILMAAAGAISVIASDTEPLDNYDCGINQLVGSTTASYIWADADGRYPDREVEAERTYYYEPRGYPKGQGIKSWWIKVTNTSTFADGSTIVNVTYSQDPPAVNDFTVQDVEHHRIALQGSHDYSFNYHCVEVVTCYCIRIASTFCKGRPVTAIMGGVDALPVWVNDVLNRNIVAVYEDRHYCFLAANQMHLYKPHTVAGKITQMETAGVVTTF